MVTSTFRSFSVARASVRHVSATAAAGRAPSRSASKTPSLVAVTMARAYTGAYASSIATGTTPAAMTADSSGFSAINPTRIAAPPHQGDCSQQRTEFIAARVADTDRVRERLR